MKPLFTFLMLTGVWVRAGCVAVGGDRILVRDLAVAVPAFAAADIRIVIGFAPQPGSVRLVAPRELTRLAARFGIAGGPFQPVCFERITVPLTAERLLPVLQKALDLRGAEIAVMDFSRYRLPPGELEFSRSGLPTAAPSNTSVGVIWRGRLVEEGGHGIPIWARVRIAQERRWIEAITDLAVNRPIDPTQLVLKSGKRFPFPEPVAAIEDAVGKSPIRTIRAGQAIVSSMLEKAADVERGDRVSVEVSSGGAGLRFSARAESSGRKGETINVRNPISGRRFPAVVQGKGKVLVNPNAETSIGNSGPDGAASHAVGERHQSVQ